MTFKKFVENIDADDNDISAFKKWLIKNPKFPASRSPDTHLVFISFGGGVFSDAQRLGYKKTMMAYFAFEANKMKKAFKEDKDFFLSTINKI